MSSLARGRGLEGLELWLAGLFSAADLAAAQLLLQLSVAGAGESEVEERVVEETALAMQSAEERVVEEPAASTELDRRARKRYRRLSELYAATSPVISDSDSDASVAKKLKRGKRHHHHDGFVSSSSSSESQSSAEEATRYVRRRLLEREREKLEGLLRN